jgi:hypothetical protein
MEGRAVSDANSKKDPMGFPFWLMARVSTLTTGCGGVISFGGASFGEAFSVCFLGSSKSQSRILKWNHLGMKRAVPVCDVDPDSLPSAVAS